jgi:dolichol kinase
MENKTTSVLGRNNIPQLYITNKGFSSAVRGSALRTEFVRKSIHLLIAFVPFFAAVNVMATLALLGAGIILYTYAELLRHRGREFFFITRITVIAAREGDRDKFVLGPITLAIGAMLALLFYPEPAATLAIFALAFGDGFSSLVGRIIGGRAIPFTGGKTITGSLTCFLIVFLVTNQLTGHAGVSCVIAAATMVLEALPTGDMDNIIIPMGTGLLAFKLLVL